jgi:hypothetical protein
MIISNSAIQLYSERTARQFDEQRQSLTVWKRSNQAVQGEGSKSQAAFDAAGNRKTALNDLIDFSHRARKGRPHKAQATPVSEDAKNITDLNIRVLASMVERFTGKAISITLPQDVAALEEAPVVAGQVPAPVEQQSAAQNVGIIYDHYESHYEYESTSFAADGVIQTADGKTIDISVQLNMTREFMSEQSISIRAGDALKDPLMLNFNGSAADITQRDFSFDIDVDGRKDQIAFAGQNSGFLALDKNGDQQINDGSELFGALSGNGFADLAQYDKDGNSWIDENDAIYKNLRIWMKDGNGEDRLFSLGEMGVGAIYLNHIDTPFSLKNTENELLGQVRASGIFLGEDGSVGTVQQVDLAA